METVEEETARVRAGNLREAADMAEVKAELSRRYATESERVMAARALIVERSARCIRCACASATTRFRFCCRPI